MRVRALVELGIPTIVAEMIDNGVAKGDSAYIYRMGGVIALISVVGVSEDHSARLLLRPNIYLYHQRYAKRYL